MVTLRAFSTAAEAALAKSLLDDHDIFCSLADENSYLYGGAQLAMPVRLVVAEDQLEEAARILKDPPDGLSLGPATEKENARVSSRARQGNEHTADNPWELLVISLLVSIPGIMLLVQKYDLVLIAYHRSSRRGITVIPPTGAHILGMFVIGVACFLVFLFFHVRRAIARDQAESDAPQS